MAKLLLGISASNFNSLISYCNSFMPDCSNVHVGLELRANDTNNSLSVLTVSVTNRYLQLSLTSNLLEMEVISLNLLKLYYGFFCFVFRPKGINNQNTEIQSFQQY
jgi:hypothetical protein